ncbi:MAG TPA: mechanosensitive ion channel family protein [Xanthobacteraceae bacterium]
MRWRLDHHVKALVYRTWVPTILFLALLAAVTAGRAAIDRLALRLPVDAGTAIPYVLAIATWLAGAFLLSRIVDTAIWEVLAAHQTNVRVPKLLRQLTAIIIYAIAIIAIIGFVFDQSVTALVTTSSALGLLIGFAVRSLILDAFSGIAINLEQPFRTGDFIQLRGRGPDPIMGVVQEINWRTTRLATLENDVIIIPNGILAESVILNRSAPDETSWYDFIIKLDFSVDADRAIRVLESAARMAAAEGGPLASPAPDVLVAAVDETGVHYRVAFAVDPAKMVPRKARHLLLKHVLDNLHHSGLSPALAKQDIFVARAAARELDHEDVAHRVQSLSRVDLFAAFDAAALDGLARQVMVRLVPAGSVVVEQGEPGQSMFVVVEGDLRVHVPEADGTLREAGYLRAGDFFGEMSLLTGQKRSATVRAIGDAVLYEIAKEHIATLLDAHPEIAATLTRTVAEHRLRDSAATGRLPPEERAEQKRTMVAELLRAMGAFFGRFLGGA